MCTSRSLSWTVQVEACRRAVKQSSIITRTLRVVRADAGYWYTPCVQPPPLGIIIPKGYVCLRTASAPVLNGKLEGEAWATAPWTDDFVGISTDVEPRFQTRVKMLWD